MRLLLADDHALFRSSLKRLLEAQGYEVIGEARTGHEALRLAHSLTPDLVLMDLSMPDMDGIEATRLLTSDLPEMRVVILTGSEREGQLLDALKAGAQGYLLKNLEPAKFFELLESALRGEAALSPALAGKVLQEIARAERAGSGRKDPTALTDREVEVLRLMVVGVTGTEELASRLGVSQSTIKFHIRNILEKLGLSSRAQLVSYAVRHGLIEVPDEEGWG